MQPDPRVLRRILAVLFAIVLPGGFLLLAAIAVARVVRRGEPGSRWGALCSAGSRSWLRRLAAAVRGLTVGAARQVSEKPTSDASPIDAGRAVRRADTDRPWHDP